MTWQQVVEKLAQHIDTELIGCKLCPAKDYCSANEMVDISCPKTIMAWATEQVEGENNG
jgi:hypothetical protein